MTDTTTWVALLRGINLGRHKRVSMADLRKLLTTLGYADVRTHLQSGNAVFTAAADDGAGLEAQLSTEIEGRFGFPVKVVVRSAKDFVALADANPYVTRGVDPKQLHVSFLAAAPPKATVASLDPQAYAPDEFSFGDRAIYLRLVDGVMGSRLPDWEKVLGVDATMRNWNTVVRLRELVAD
jgi:uncharacterized protein (DUF1697 family)